MNIKRKALFHVKVCFFPLLWGMVFLATSVKAQDCVDAIDQLERGNNYWIGHAYQMPFDKVPTKDFVGQEKTYKGKLLEEMLGTASMNFDILFGDTDETALENDENYFYTTCDSVKKSYFGITFRSQYTVPDKGVYMITINQDDGSSLRINGTLIHYAWSTFKHNAANEKKYYFSYNGGEVLDMVVNFFEKFHTNRVSFRMERYYGAGIISRTQSSICTADPNPDPFLSLAEAAFISETPPSYQWQYSRDPAPEGVWTDIEGATDLTYDIPRYSENTEYPFTGKMYFRRAAYTAVDDRIYTDPIDITLSLAENDSNTSEYGDLQWYGYVYDNAANFNEGDYIGKLIYPKDNINYTADFYEDFGQNSGMFEGSGSSSVPGASYTGCPFDRETFSVRYKMKMVVTPGTYNFKVGGDDGFRMSISDGENYLVPRTDNWAINRWSNGSEVTYELTQDIEITETTTLYFVIEYYENIVDNTIFFESFKDVFSILPVEWGQVSGNPCGNANCVFWQTIQEKNTSHFEVERSHDGIQWFRLEQIISASGYSTERINYQLTDNTVSEESTYYRIKQVDLDGAIGYSKVIRIDSDALNRVISYPFPNPTKNKIRFYSKEEVLYAELISQDYKINIKPEIARVGDDLYELDLENLGTMHYVLTIIKKSGEKEVYKIIKK